MTVAELIEKLQEMPQDAPVCCTGDELEAVYYDKRMELVEVE